MAGRPCESEQELVLGGGREGGGGVEGGEPRLHVPLQIKPDGDLGRLLRLYTSGV